MKNKFDKNCDRCDQLVEAGQGFFKFQRGVPVVFHPVCDAEETKELAWYAAEEKQLIEEIKADPKAMAYMAGKGIQL